VIIIPAIDLLNGEAVRLYKGDYDKKTVYSKDPVGLAKNFEKMGARYLHVVDLNGAKDGNTINIEAIRKIKESVNIPVEVGGGIRNAEAVSLYLDELKIDRIILGTIAVNSPDFVKEVLAEYTAERIIVSVDVLKGEVAINGWLQGSSVNYLEFIGELKTLGVKYIIVTDISKDGALTSPNWAMYEKIEGINVIVSGGVACEDDIEKAKNYYGIIVGKAYYEGKVDLEKCLKRE